MTIKVKGLLAQYTRSKNMNQKGRAISDPALDAEEYEKLLYLLEHDQSTIRRGDINISSRAHSHGIRKFDHGIAAD